MINFKDAFYYNLKILFNPSNVFHEPEMKSSSSTEFHATYFLFYNTIIVQSQNFLVISQYPFEYFGISKMPESLKKQNSL